MEYVRDTDKTHKGYKYYIDIQDQISQGDKKEYLSRLTTQQKEDLNKYKTLLRQRKFSEKDNNKETYNSIRKEYITNLRVAKPEEMREQNRKDNKNFRERNKAKEEQIRQKLRENNAKITEDKEKAKIKIADAIKARKAQAKYRAELKELKEEEERKATKANVSDILNNIIDTIPKKAQQKRNKEAQAKYKAKKEAGEPTKTYNTRSRAKK